MGRRGHGEGSITQRKDGRWMAALTLDNHKRKYFYSNTRKEVQDKLNKALYEQKQGTLATGPQQTLAAYLEKWLEYVVKLTLEPNTYQQYRSVVRYHLVPALGQIKLQKLTTAMIQALYAQKQQEGKSSRTIAIIHSVLSSALENAISWDLVTRNVAKSAKHPTVEHYEAQTLTMEQALKLLEVARGTQMDAMLLFALTTGMRRGEILSLRWEDIDFERSVVFVHRTVNRIVGQGFVEGEPKTKAGRRRILLPDVAIEALKSHKVAQEQARIKAGEKWVERGIVFSNTKGGFLSTNLVRRRFRELLKNAGLPGMRFHDLRHSAATILLGAKVQLKVVSERLGHASIATTADIYSHVLPEMQQEVVDKIDGLFKGS